jgi:hypothetical protein
MNNLKEIDKRENCSNNTDSLQGSKILRIQTKIVFNFYFNRRSQQKKKKEKKKRRPNSYANKRLTCAPKKTRQTLEEFFASKNFFLITPKSDQSREAYAFGAFFFFTTFGFHYEKDFVAAKQNVLACV